MSVRAIWRRLQKHNFSLKSLKIKENDPKYFLCTPAHDNAEREQFVIWSSTAACQTLEEISICNSYLCASKELFQKGPMRPMAILNFDRLKSIRIEMDAQFWEKHMNTICSTYYPPANSNWNLRPPGRRPPPRFSLIDNTPNLENLSIEYNFNLIRSQRWVSTGPQRPDGRELRIQETFDLFGEASLKRKLQLIIVYLGYHSIYLIIAKINFLFQRRFSTFHPSKARSVLKPRRNCRGGRLARC